MTLFRVEHKRNYTVVNNFICTDKRLTWKAKGLWLYAFSRPDDWEFHINDLINQGPDGRDSVRAGLKELSDCGYLKRSRKRNADGTLSDAIWTFYETPQELKESLPETENPILENHPLLSTESLPSTEKEQQLIDTVATIPESATLPKVVVSSLDSLDIKPELKTKILREHSIDEINTAVKRAVAWTTRSNDQAAIMTCLRQKDTWLDNPNPEDVESQNRAFLKTLASLDNRVINLETIVIGHCYIEFSCYPKMLRFEVIDRDFIKNVKERLKFLGLRISQ